jgi:hypothetical protein
MKKFLLLAVIAVSLILLNTSVKAQLPAGSYGANFTMQDYLGTTYSLYDYTDAGKPVIMDVSATWCGPCWNYHTSGALETYYGTYGPPGDNTSMVFWIEGDQSNLNCLQGITGCDNGTSQGNWTSGTTFPMILTCAPNTNQVVTDYAIGYFPTIYLICPNRKVTEPGQLTSVQLHTAALGCPAAGVNALDVAVWSAKVPSALCAGSISSTFYLQNYGSTTLTSCNVIVKLDGSTVSTTPWTGSLAKYAISQVTIPAVTGVTEGPHTLTFELSSPNGGTDENATNNSIDVAFNAGMLMGSTPLFEGFVNTAFPPTNWVIDNPDNGDTWARSTAAGGFGNSTNSAFIDFYNISSGAIDDITLPPLDLSLASNATMTFNVAHARYSASYSDNLKIQVSTDCGATWANPYNKSGATLATTTTLYTTEFVPTAAQWRAETVDLNSFVGQSKVFIRIRGTSGYGNDCYIDDINITTTTSVEEQANPVSYVNVYPNPTAGNTAIEFVLSNEENVSISVKNLLGQDVISYDNKTYSSGSHTVYFTTDNLSQGVYYLNMLAGGQKKVQKIVVVK